MLQACRERLRQIHRGYRRKVSLIGWSPGGVCARELARQIPPLERLVITLDTPFTGHPQATNARRGMF